MPRGGAEPILRVLELREAHVLKLSDIDLHANSFTAHIWISIAFPGGSTDADLNRPGSVFPMDSDGKPTFRPSAMWYAEQLQFSNALDIKRTECLIVAKGDDLICNTRWEGRFFEEFELQEFPFDTQALTMSMSINSRTKGMLPVIFGVNGTSAGIDHAGFTMRAAYELDESLYVRVHEIGADPERMFPAVSISALVRRHHMYYTLNGFAPFLFFSLIAILQLTVPCVTNGDVDDVAIDHRAQLTMTVVLTAAAYKVSIGSNLPQIAYLTQLDVYMLGSGLLIILSAIECRLLNLAVAHGLSSAALERLDVGFLCGFLCLWLLTQAWYLSQANCCRRAFFYRSRSITAASYSNTFDPQTAVRARSSTLSTW